MSRIIFNKIYNKIQALQKEISNEKYSDSEKEEIGLHLKRLKFVFKDLYNAEYIKKESARLRLQYYIDSGFSYDQTAEHFHTSIGTIHTAITRYSQTALDYIGKESLANLLNGDIEEGFKQASNGSNITYLKTLLMPNFIDELPKKKRKEGAKVYDCVNELGLFKLLSYNYIRKQIQTRNKENLSFLLYILMSNDAEYNLERKLLYDYLTGDLKSKEDSEKEMPLSELVEYFKQINI